jgi:hypothetical protein
MKHIKLYEDFLNEEATTSWSKMMKGVRAGGSGPWSIVAIQDKKVVGQSIDIKTPDLIPAKYEALKRECPKAKLHIEDGGGMVVWTGPLNEGVSMDAVYIHQITGCGQDAAQNFIDDNGIDGEKLADYVKRHKDSKEKYDVRDIIAGTGVGKIESFRKRFIKSVQESEINEGHDGVMDKAPGTSKEEATKKLQSWIDSDKEEGGDLKKFVGVKWVGTMSEDGLDKLAMKYEDAYIVLGMVDNELTYAWSRRS